MCDINSKINYTVDIDEANNFTEDIKKKIPNIGGFCSKFKINNTHLATSCDGCGTKLDLANKYNKLDNIGIDLVAMNVNDLIAGGAKPLYFMDYISIDKINREKCNNLIDSINQGCLLANCKLIGGETAEMRDIYIKDKFDLAGFVIGEAIYDIPRMNQINNDCFIYGLKSSGPHSNGYTLIRDILDKIPKENIDMDIINQLLVPTKIYNEVLDICRENSEIILGIAHITGGGFKDNIKRILPEKYDFKLYNWEFPDIFKWIQKNSNLNREEMLNIFNCGYGMVFITNTYLNIPNIDIIGYIIEK